MSVLDGWGSHSWVPVEIDGAVHFAIRTPLRWGWEWLTYCDMRVARERARAVTRGPVGARCGC